MKTSPSPQVLLSYSMLPTFLRVFPKAFHADKHKVVKGGRRRQEESSNHGFQSITEISGWGRGQFTFIEALLTLPVQLALTDPQSCKVSAILSILQMKKLRCREFNTVPVVMQLELVSWDSNQGLHDSTTLFCVHPVNEWASTICRCQGLS